MPMTPPRLLEMQRILIQAFRATNDPRLKPATRQRAYTLLLATKNCIGRHYQSQYGQDK